jgi:hypothetical protein
MSDAAGPAPVLAARMGRRFRPAIDAGTVGVAAVGSASTSAGALALARPANPSAAGFGATREVGTASTGTGAAPGCVEAASTCACTWPSRRTKTSPAPSKTAAATARNNNTPLARVRTATRDV